MKKGFLKNMEFNFSKRMFDITLILEILNYIKSILFLIL